ncbi:hypothetical protein GCM10007415_39350 [Parapedobacter pyrenivorans]|uniref:TonB-dependent receptor plug domain-containing protein n=1 Tax=Parapedobacter pyrenivorans TaxID=1305674 RepID=A0A917I0I3_9SPHI|nr:carboxypeptidase-like regulatory domain-containing protein [Parapedobacter pyrenivorans]GGG99645.1 hypothetical protein GCM10007415_39350 [Parapedobacter pyrenivorans]
MSLLIVRDFRAKRNPYVSRLSRFVIGFAAALVIGFIGGYSPCFAQENITGIVLDENSQPLTGVSITVRPGIAQTVTDESGNFRLVASIGDTLEFSFLGYEPATRVIESADPITETLVVAGATDLEEVVVVGYGTQKKSNLTGAVSAVNARELTNISPSNLSNTLAGRAPGVNVTNTSGLSGATSNIRIRGASANRSM